MTKEEIELLQKWENQFRLAIRANFVRMTAREFGEFAKDYAKFHTPLTQGQMVCNTCRLRALTTLGNEYFAAVQEEAIKEAEKRKNENNNESEGKKKTGRPKKIKLEE